MQDTPMVKKDVRAVIFSFGGVLATTVHVVDANSEQNLDKKN
ncbi:hypothetical protein [Candidatus Nitrosocosmicus hydrocola]|nr:hypothetical protein [Candidatus Nitrosocosmicus hydrocola]